MDRHDPTSPGRNDESHSFSPPSSHSTEYLSSEQRPSRAERSAAARTSGRRRTLVISAAAAVVAAAVAAGGVIALTGDSGTAAPASSSGKQVAGQSQADPAEDAEPVGPEADPGDATLEDAPGDAAPGSAGSGGAGSGGSGGGGQDAPVRDGESAAKNKPKDDAAAPRSGGSGVGPDGSAGYVEPLPQQPNAFKGIGRFEFPGPKSKPSATPKPKPSASATPKPSRTPTPTPTSKPSTPSGGGSKLVTAEDEVARLTNAARAEQGCGPLRIDEKLRAAARGHSDDMAAKGYFDHTSADGRSPWDRIKAAGYKSSMFAENIARGQATPEAVVKAWLNSPGHRANIMNCKLKAIGVGVHFGSGGPWWTQDFGGD